MSVPAYPAYRESGVAWIGAVPASWQAARIKDAFNVVNGATPRSDVPEYWDGDIVWVTPADLGGLKGRLLFASQRSLTASGLASCAATLVPPGSIVLSTRAPIGSVGIAGVELCTNQGNRALVPRNNMSSKFFAYTLGLFADQLNLYGRGTTFLELSSDALGAFPIPLPPPHEQRAIAAFLDRECGKIDGLVAEQERLVALLKEKRQAVISEAVTKGLDPTAPTKPSGLPWLGNVPAHWEVKRIGALFGQVFDEGEHDLPVLSVSIHDGVSDRELADEEMERKVSRSEDRSKYKKVQPGDLVYNMMRAWQGGFGTVAVPGMVSPAYVVARPKITARPQYIELLLRTPSAVEEMRRHSRGVTDFRLRLYWDEFKNIKVPVPPLAEQDAILEAIDVAVDLGNSLTTEAERAIALLRERRAALISAAVTGKIDVRGLAPAAEAA